MDISVIIPTKNRHELLKLTIDSVLTQKEQPSEIVIVDGSLEREIVLKNMMLCEDRGLRYYKQNYNTFKGVSGARNQAVSLSSSEYLCFLDDDDIWLEDYLTHVKIEIAKGYNLIFTGIFKKKGKQIFKYKIPPKNITQDDLLVRNPGIQGSNMTVSRTFFDQINGFDEMYFSHIFEDSDFMLRALKHPKLKYKSIPEYLIIYLSHSGKRLSMTKTPAQSKGIENFYEQYKEIMTENQKAEFIKRAQQLWQTEIIK